MFSSQALPINVYLIRNFKASLLKNPAMKIIITVTLLFSFCTISAQSNKSKQIVSDKAYKKAIQAAEKYLDSLHANQHIPGLSVCVGTRDKILWAEGFGYADLENKIPVNIHSAFRLGSVSKVLTSLAAGKLYQQGKLNLDAPVQQYLPYFPEKKYPVTARQLAGHTAGIRHYRITDPLATPKRYTTIKDGISIFINDSLMFKPGTSYMYSSYGYNLLSAVIEAAAEKDFLSYMRDSIFLPLGMKNTFPDYSDSIIPGRVRFYENLKTGEIINAALVDNSYKWAGGGFLSTPSDLVNMMRSLINHQMLDRKTVELMFTDQKLENGTSTHVGIAWRINETKKGTKYIHHGGLSDGARSFVFFYPESCYIVAITANTSNAKLNIDEAATILEFFSTNK
jgi:CubicO group peptidase (beta-lactamase class C family)